MKSLFPPIPSIEPWVDSYSGKMHVPLKGEEAEKHGAQHSAHSNRRLLFLEGNSKPTRPEGESQEAEVMVQSFMPTRDFIQGASKFFGGSAMARQGRGLAKLDTPLPSAPMRNVPLKDDKVNLEKEIVQTGEGLKQSAQNGVGGRVKTRDAQPLPSQTTVKQSSTNLTADNELKHSEKLFNDIKTARAVQSYTPTQIQASLNLKDESKAKDIVLEILSRNLGVDTMAKEELKDIALKLTLAPVEKSTQSIDLIQQALALSPDHKLDKSIKDTRSAPQSISVEQRTSVGAKDLKAREAIQHAVKTVLSTDVLLAIQRSQQLNLKEDSEEQLRIGTWAVHVLAGRMDTVPAEILRGMKKDALQALGRLSMQLLSSAKSANSQYEARQHKTLAIKRQGGQELSILKASGGMHDQKEDELGTVDSVRENFGEVQKSAIKSTNEFFRMESVQGDLQALQNNIKLDFTADMLVEGFIEALRNDDLENATEMRTDVLTQFQANQSARAPQGKDTQAGRASLGTFAYNAKVTGSTNARTELFSQRGVGFEADMHGDRSIHNDLEPELILSQETVDHQEEGAWANVPVSKYSD
jgi:hypothetical protein